MRLGIGFESPKPTHSNTLPPSRTHLLILLIFSNSFVSLWLSIQLDEPLGVIFIQTTTVILCLRMKICTITWDLKLNKTNSSVLCCKIFVERIRLKHLEVGAGKTDQQLEALTEPLGFSPHTVTAHNHLELQFQGIRSCPLRVESFLRQLVLVNISKVTKRSLCVTQQTIFPGVSTSSSCPVFHSW